MTYSFGLYITLNLNHQIGKIEIINSTILKIQSTGIININVFVENKHT